MIRRARDALSEKDTVGGLLDRHNSTQDHGENEHQRDDAQAPDDPPRQRPPVRETHRRRLTRLTLSSTQGHGEHIHERKNTQTGSYCATASLPFNPRLGSIDNR